MVWLALATSAFATDVDLFDPAASLASGKGTLQGEAAGLGDPGFIGGVVAAFAQNLVMRTEEDGTAGPAGPVVACAEDLVLPCAEVRALAPVTLHAGWTGNEWLRVDFLLPVYAWVDAPLTDFQGSAVGDVRLQATIPFFYSDDGHVAAALIPRLGVPSGTPDALVTKGVNGTLIASLTGEVGPVGGVLNAGVLVAENQPLEERAIGSSADFTAGAWWWMVEGLRVGGEVDARAGLVRNDDGTNNTAAWHAFVQSVLGSGLGFVAGGGRGLTTGGIGSPELRVVGALTFVSVIHDTDADGITDELDSCTTEAEDLDGWEDADGCPELDNDWDGVLDGADRCPVEAEDPDAYEDGDGCPDPDNDGDGVLDQADACPLEPGSPDHQGCPDTDGDGLADRDDLCPQQPGPLEFQGCPDRDSDGVPDLRDKCPDEPKPRDEDPAASDGCPKTVYVTRGEIKITERVEFETGKAALRPVSFPILDKVVAILREFPTVAKVEVQGHTDNVGSDSYNLKLSNDRAASVRAYLIKKGVHANRLVSKGYGESKPLLSNKTPKGREANRRVQFVILDGGPVAAAVVKSGSPTDPAPVPTPTTPPPAPAPLPLVSPHLPPAPVFPPGSPPGRLTVQVQGGYWAIVQLDGRPLQKAAPFADLELEPGRHELRATNARLGLDWASLVDVAPNEPITVVVPFADAPAPRPVPVVAPAPVPTIDARPPAVQPAIEGIAPPEPEPTPRPAPAPRPPRGSKKR